MKTTNSRKPSTPQTDWAKRQATMEQTREIKEYLIWTKLTFADKDKIKMMWDNYFEKVKSTRAHAILQEMRVAVRKEDMNKIKQLRAECKRLLESPSELPKPPGRDPEEYNRGVFEEYRNAKRLAAQQDEWSGVESIFG